MTIPLRAKLFWTLMHVSGQSGIFERPREQVRAASDRRARAIRLPGASLITGGTHRGAQVGVRKLELRTGATIGLRIHRPSQQEAALPLVLNFHGGGFAAGDAVQSEWLASSVAAAGAVVVSPEYRLAPEHPFPAGLQDCFAATEWSAEHAADLGADANRIAVMGDSAGGNLAAVVALMARDRGSPVIRAQVLLYPAVDFVGEYTSERENGDGPVVSKREVDNVLSLYFAPGDLGRIGEPYASPLRARTHQGLPPALIVTAEHDPLRDQGTAYAEALLAASVPVRLTNYADGIHGFFSTPGLVPCARAALREVTEFLAATVG